MVAENRKPLIRKKYSFIGILKIIFSKFRGAGKGSDLRIPRFAESVGFKSLAPPSGTDGAAGKVPRPNGERILSEMRSKGIRGFGGAGYPMADKLETVLASRNQEKVLIVNGVECDPGLHHDKWLLENKREELEEICGMLRDAFGLSGVYLAKKAGSLPVDLDGVTTVDVPDTYPAGEENRLVSWLLGVEMPKGAYPAGKGIWVQNVQSLLVLHSVLGGHRPLRYLTMTDLEGKRAFVVECDPGASIRELSESVFGRQGRLHVGGGIMQALPAEGSESLDSGINLIAVGEAAEFSDGDCHHCGQCTKHCPAGLSVEDLVAEIAKGGDISREIREECSRCGACSFLCPAGKDVCSLIASA